MHRRGQHAGMFERLKHLLQPLNLAGLLTWSAVLLSMRAEVGGFTPLRVGLMGVFLIGFLVLDLPGLRKRTQAICVWVELAAALGVIALAPRTGTAAVLLVILAAQVGMLYGSWRQVRWWPRWRATRPL